MWKALARMPCIAVVACMAACTEEAPRGPGIEATSHVATYELAQRGPPALDLLIVVDDTTAMAPYLARVAALPAVIQQGLRPQFDLRIGVTTNGGALRRSAAIAEPFVATQLGFDLVRTGNYPGTLGEALAGVVNVGATNAAASQPLAAMRTALEGPDRFLRDNAPLGIVIVTASDDASPGAIGEYVSWLSTLKGDPFNVAVTTISAAPTPRLDELLAAHLGPTLSVSIDASEHSPAFERINRVSRATLAGICWSFADVDADTPGAQYECTMTATIRGSEQLLPPCARSPDHPLCWELVPSDEGCWELGDASEAVKPRIALWNHNWFHPAMRVECVVRRE